MQHEYMRQFYLAFPIRHALRDELEWTHYRICRNPPPRDRDADRVGAGFSAVTWNRRGTGTIRSGDKKPERPQFFVVHLPVVSCPGV